MLDTVQESGNPVLSQVAFDYTFPQNAGYALFPVVLSHLTEGKIATFDKDSFRLLDSRRALGAKAQRVSRSADYVPVTTDRRTLEYATDILEYQDGLMGPKERWQTQVSHLNTMQKQIGLEFENQQAALARNLYNYTSDHVKDLTSNPWSNYSTSSPVSDIEDAQDVIRQSIGVAANTMLISYDVWKYLKRHPELVGTTGESAMVTPEYFGHLFGLSRVVIAESVYLEGGNLQLVWGKDAVLAYVPDRVYTTEEPAYGYTVRRFGYPKVDTYFDNSSTSEVIQVEDNMGAVIVGSIAGYLFQNAAS